MRCTIDTNLRNINLATTTDIFLTDQQFEALFGSEIARITRILNQIAREKCSTCKGACCQQIECRLYSEKLNGCPIYEIRPRECRYHFCNEILTRAPLSRDYKDLLMKPITELLGDKKGPVSSLFTQFPTFPLDDEGLCLLGIKEKASSIMNAWEHDEIDESQARGLLKSLCLKAASFTGQ